jgi:hypothetical protein
MRCGRAIFSESKALLVAPGCLQQLLPRSVGIGGENY